MRDPRTLHDLTYVLPIRRDRYERDDELTMYLTRLTGAVQVVVADGSAAEVFSAHDDDWAVAGVQHLEVASRTLNGKVAGVVDGVSAARTPYVVIADDDVRYDLQDLVRLRAMLQETDAVVPQNYFSPLPWHARIDTGRTLLNRALAHDYAGTIAFRTSAFTATRGYCGAVLFENLELLRTLRSAGFTVRHADDLLVRRLPPDTTRFLDQRVRQAYDSAAQPGRRAFELALLPLTIAGLRRPVRLLAGVAAAIGLAHYGRMRSARSREVFTASAPLWAPVWLMERAVCAWLALAAQARGGVGYAGSRLRTAAHSRSRLRNPGCPEPACVCSTPLRDGAAARASSRQATRSRPLSKVSR